MPENLTNIDLEVVTAGIHHVTTMQGTNSLTNVHAPEIMAGIEQQMHAGQEILVEGPFTVAIFMTDMESTTKINYTAAREQTMELRAMKGTLGKNIESYQAT